MATSSEKEKAARLFDEVFDIAAEAYNEDALACAEEMMWEDPAIVAFIRDSGTANGYPFNFQRTHFVKATFAAMAAQQSSPKNKPAQELRRMVEADRGPAGSQSKRVLEAIGRYTGMLRTPKQHLQ